MFEVEKSLEKQKKQDWTLINITYVSGCLMWAAVGEGVHMGR